MRLNAVSPDGLRVFLIMTCLLVQRAHAQEQKSDPDFDARVEKPAYPSAGPRVLFDEAHRNFHTADGRYKPFADLIRNDGYQVTANRETFTSDLLSKHDILVIANALGTPKKIDSAFTDAECDTVRDWVRGGGALLLIADHYPMGHAAENLAKRFDVAMSKGMTDEYDFTPQQGLAASHPIMRGRSSGEEIRRVRTFTGQSIRGPAGSVSLLTMPAGAQELTPDVVDPENRDKAKKGPVAHPDQGIAFGFGKGRVVVLAEAGMLSAQLVRGEKFGMNVPDIDNRQLALNIMHWLSGLLPQD